MIEAPTLKPKEADEIRIAAAIETATAVDEDLDLVDLLHEDDWMYRRTTRPNNRWEMIASHQNGKVFVSVNETEWREI